MKRSLLVVTCVLMGLSMANAAQTTLNVGMGSADAGKLDPHLATTTPDKGLLHWMYNLSLIHISEPTRPY